MLDNSGLVSGNGDRQLLAIDLELRRHSAVVVRAVDHDAVLARHQSVPPSYTTTGDLTIADSESVLLADQTRTDLEHVQRPDD
jgi:hypothetical protein